MQVILNELKKMKLFPVLLKKKKIEPMDRH